MISAWCSRPAAEKRFRAAEIQRLLLSGQSHTRLKNGKLAVIDTGAVEELQEVLRDCAPQQHAQGYRISNTQAGFLESTLRQHTRLAGASAGSLARARARQSGEAPSWNARRWAIWRTCCGLTRKQGVAWLQFLRENGFGGILADEMGLGKTLQTLAFLRCRAPDRSNRRVRAACWSSARPAWSSTGSRKRRNSRPS